MKNVILLALLLTGCASYSGVIPDGKESYIVIASGGHGFASSGDLKIDAYQEANAYCTKLDKQLETISVKTTEAGILNKFSEAELKFRCIAR
jgi:hypothetical protein